MTNLEGRCCSDSDGDNYGDDMGDGDILCWKMASIVLLDDLLIVLPSSVVILVRGPL